MSAVAQEFHLSVTPLEAQDKYLVRIEKKPDGVPLAEEQVTWYVEDWLVKARQLMNDPLFNLLHGTSSLNMVAFGQELYNSLFCGSLRDSWITAQGIAQNHRTVLRLRLELKGTHLPRLPWEILHEGDRPLATGTDVTFSRYQLSINRSRPFVLPQPKNKSLRILIVISGPSDQETLDLKKEVHHLREELRESYNYKSPAIELKILEQPGREQLTQALEQGQYQVFHYAGHSNLGADGGDLYLVSDKTGLTETLSGNDLAGLLVNNGVQMAVFNSCRGADTATSAGLESGREQNLANALIRRGIPGVLAMAERIPDDVALTLTRLLYRNINQGYSIDLSLNRARQGLISAYSSNQLYWALPVLYLHPEFDGFLTGSPKAENAVKRLTERAEMSLVSEEEILYRGASENNNGEILNPLNSYQLSSADYLTDDQETMPDFDDDFTYESESEEDRAIVTDLLNNITTTAVETRDLTPPLTPKAPISIPQNVTNSPSSPPLITSENRSLPPLKIGNFDLLRIINNKPSQIQLLLGIISITAVSLLGMWFWQNRHPQSLEVLSSSPNSSAQSSKLANLKTATTAKVTAFAIEQFSMGNIAAAKNAVEELLKPERGALLQAEAALNVVPTKQQNIPEINFLHGRLAWQSVQSGNTKYNIDDARRYWELAAKDNPQSALYLNALGFALYAQGNFNRANDAWFKALYQIPAEEVKIIGSPAQKDLLNANAGLALVFKKLAEKYPEQREKLLSESLKLRQKVITDAPIDFQPDALSKNWLWDEKTIADWRSLLNSNIKSTK